MPYVEIDGRQICYELSEDAGHSPRLPTLVLSHSLGVSLAMWEPQLEALHAHVRVLRYDVRGHGESSVGAVPYSIAELGQDVVTLLDRLEIESASFCGLSMGGAIGQWLGIFAAARIDKLILASTAAKIGSAETWNARIDQVTREGLAPVIPGTLERWFTAEFRALHPEIIHRTAELLRATRVEGYAACCAAIRDADFRDHLHSITVPTLIVSGTHDPVTPPSDGRFLADSIAASTYLELPAAHLASVEASGRFNAALLDFLKG